MAAERVVRAHRRQAAARGVALIEVMVGLLIFLVGVLGVIGLQAKAIQFTVQAEDRSRASLLANELVTHMWSQQSTHVSDGDLKSWHAEVSERLPDAKSSVTQDNGVVTITIEWKSPRAAAGDKAANQYVTQVALP